VETFLVFFYRNTKALRIRLPDLDGRAGHGMVNLWEAEEWKFVETRLFSLQRLIHSIIESYIQEISLQEAQHSNSQAHSVRRLTAMATIFVPISAIAGIFSMSGKFAVGESKFWVFFVITVPIILIIIAFLFTNVSVTVPKNITAHFLSPKHVIARTLPHLPGFKRGKVSRENKILPLFRRTQL
jgi:hypothetical protein